MFDDRLKNLRIQLGLTQKDIAEMLNLPQTTYRNYEQDCREPTATTLKRLADFYGVSCDYLLGFESEKKSPEEAEEETEILNSIVEELKSFTKEERLKVRDYCDYIKYLRK